MKRKVNKWMIASLVGSALAIGATLNMVVNSKLSRGATHTGVQQKVSFAR
jgi:hypothetical protein